MTTKTLPTLQQATAAVEAHLGFIEGGGADGRSGNITPWGARTGTQGQPWCASGLTCVLADAGAPVAIRTAVRTMEAEARAAGKWSSTPAPGYIMVFDFDRSGVADHCEFVTGVLARQVNTIGYNTSPTDAGDQRNGGGVYRRTRRSDATTVRGYIVLEYASAVIPVPREEPQPTVLSPVQTPAPKRVKVKKGQTLTRIAAVAGVSLAALLAVNPSLAKDPGRILPGQYVTIPGQGTPSTAPAPSQTPAGTGAPSTAPSPSAVPTAPRPVLSRYIGPWTKGDDVKAVQRVLGFTGRDVDGIGGPNTATRLRNYQRAHGLEPDAVVGRATAEAMGFEWKGPR